MALPIHLLSRLPIMTNIISHTQLESMIVAPIASIGEAIARLDKAGTGALAVCSDNRKLV